jgi:hypothetical protein
MWIFQFVFYPESVPVTVATTCIFVATVYLLIGSQYFSAPRCITLWVTVTLFVNVIFCHIAEQTVFVKWSVLCVAIYSMGQSRQWCH